MQSKDKYLIVRSQDSIVAGLAGGCEIYRSLPTASADLAFPSFTFLSDFHFAVDHRITFAPFCSSSSLPLKAWQRSVA